MLSLLRSRWTTPCACAAFERIADLSRDIDHAREWQRTFVTDNMLESPATQKFHYEEDVSAFVFTKISDADCIRMCDTRRRAGLAREAGHDLFVSGERGTQNFDRNCLVHQHVTAAIDSAHAAFVQSCVNAIFSGERNADECVGIFFERHAVGRTQRRRIRILNSTLRTCLHLMH